MYSWRPFVFVYAFSILGICLFFITTSALAADRSMKNVMVTGDPGRFSGWPANNGAWIWGKEIAVAFTLGYYEANVDNHSISKKRPSVTAIGRSKDGGETWTMEEHPELDNSKAIPSPGGIDFSHPDLALRCSGNRFYVSSDRGRTWQGPFALGDFGMGLKLTTRTDYLVESRDSALLFLSAERPGVQAAGYKDRAFVARTRDGGKTFEFVSWINDQPQAVRGVMPSTVRVSPTELVSVLRRRYDIEQKSENQICWLDAFGSGDNGASWQQLARVAYTDLGGRNGNPPSLVGLKDGRLIVTYGFRGIPYGIRAKISSDNGKTWGPEIILRDDAGTWDLGYPRSVVRPDGIIVTIYYFNTAQRPEPHIEATIWSPN